jgi:hypothetical protein
MAARSSEAANRLAVERALARVPDLLPDSVEVVELVRGRPYVIVHTPPEAVAVLDERGRLVRGKARLAAVARHLDATGRVGRLLEQTLLERRRAHVEQSMALLRRQLSRYRRGSLRDAVAELLAELDGLGASLDGLEDDLRRQRGLPPTVRTLRRTVVLLNEAARADRRVVLATRSLAAEVARSRRGRDPAETLTRWIAARLASSDLPFYVAELDERESDVYVEGFVASARA